MWNDKEYKQYLKDWKVCSQINSVIFLDVFGNSKPILRGVDTYSQTRVLEVFRELFPEYKFYYARDLNLKQFLDETKYFKFMQMVYGHTQGKYRIYAIIPDSIFFKHENRQEAVSHLVEWQQKHLSDYAKMNDTQAINYINKRLNYQKNNKQQLTIE